MKFFIFIFLALLAAATIGMLVVFYYVRKGINYFRRFSTGEMSGEDFERMANKYYRKQESDSDRFGDDYFKGSAWQQRPNGGTRQNSTAGRQQRRKNTTAAGGITIEDRRDPSQAGKKIFGHDEGEYVDFTEN